MLKYFRLVPVAIFLAAFISYLFTLTPTVDFIDSGELAAVCSTLGIAHPTGYPLFTLIGHLFSYFPIADAVIDRLNIMSALFAGLGAALFSLLVKETIGILTRDGLTRRGERRKSRRKKIREKTDGDERVFNKKLEWLAAASAGLLLSWSTIFWEVGTTLEVYSLHALFIILLLYLAIVYARNHDKMLDLRWGLLFFFILGLSLANHLTTGLLFPAFMLLFLTKYITQRTPVSRIIMVMFPVLLGLVFYLYLPIRAASRPLIMWGEPTTAAAIWDNLTVADFSSRLFAHQSEGETLLDFFSRFPGRIGYLPIPLVIWGMVLLYRKAKIYFFFIIAVFIPAILYAATYNVGDNIFYFNSAYIALLIFAGVGAYGLFVFLQRKFRLLWPSFFLMIIIFIPELVLNYPRVDKKNNYFVEDYIRNIFSAIKPNAILFALDCQIIIHPLYYYQTVEHFRNDVLVLPNHGLQKGWFADRLRDHYPEIYQRSAGEIEDYRNYLKLGEKAEPRLLDKKYYTMLSSIISNNAERPVYITSEFNPVQNPYFHPGYYRIPEGLCWRLYREGEIPDEFPYREFSYHELTYPHKDADAVRHAYMYMLNERGRYEASRGNFDLALRWINQALRVYPGKELLSDRYNGTWVIPNRFREVKKTRERVIGKIKE